MRPCYHGSRTRYSRRSTPRSWVGADPLGTLSLFHTAGRVAQMGNLHEQDPEIECLLVHALRNLCEANIYFLATNELSEDPIEIQGQSFPAIDADEPCG